MKPRELQEFIGSETLLQEDPSSSINKEMVALLHTTCDLNTRCVNKSDPH